MTETISQDYCRRAFLRLQELKQEIKEIREPFVQYRVNNNLNLPKTIMLTDLEATFGKLLMNIDGVFHQLNQWATLHHWIKKEVPSPNCRLNDKRCKDC